eukprot:TRINITY_DN7145_c0_g1_i3.p2 TRINITY_DN7145_c0_g1~~TRINITY_DN7145_c0_g1_i3.p2  ORF type:complete len:181 (+),score=14.85 TRINITY_DN7145_c0_g1_i3:1261-1803(+)
MGSSSHRSAFCTTPRNDWLKQLHACHRASIQELHEAGFESLYAGVFTSTAHTITPPLHDINGFIAILAEILPDGPAVQKAVLGSSTCSNMTGNQARDVLSRLLTITKTKGVQHLLCIAMEMLVHFRYNDIPIKYHQEGKCAKEFIFSLIAMHILVFVLEWVSPGRTSEGRGVTYIHLMSH